MMDKKMMIKNHFYQVKLVFQKLILILNKKQNYQKIINKNLIWMQQRWVSYKTHSNQLEKNIIILQMNGNFINYFLALMIKIKNCS